MGGACGTYGVEKRCIEGFGWEIRVKRPLGRPRRKRMNILIFQK